MEEPKYTEADFLSAYIGEDVSQYGPESKNWRAAALGQFIGPVWFFYRKAYLLGFAFIILTAIITEIASYLNIPKAYYLMGLIYLLTANRLYLWDVKRKVQKIRDNNFSRSDNEIMEIIARKGGTSKIATTIYIIIALAFLVFIFLALIATQKEYPPMRY